MGIKKYFSGEIDRFSSIIFKQPVAQIHSVSEELKSDIEVTIAELAAKKPTSTILYSDVVHIDGTKKLSKS